MSTTEKKTGDISSKEFQQQLFDWFDKRGLLSELRTFMRHRMISALYSNETPCPGLRFTSDKSASISPTLQALLLLIVEFLVKQEYHYTMSIFVAEAPLIATFPYVSGYVSYVPQHDTVKSGSQFPRYSEKDVQDIMKVFGITIGSECMDHILRLYKNNNAREPLLVCALTALSAIVVNGKDKAEKSPRKESCQEKEEVYNTTYWIEEIRLVLLRAKVTAHQLQQVEELLRKLQAETASGVRKMENEKHNKLLHIREQELLAEALVQEEKIRAQHLAAEEDLKSKQKHLEKVTIQLRQQHDLVLDRLGRVQRHADEIKERENSLIEKEKLLRNKQEGLEEEHRTLAGLRSELQEAAHFLRQEHSDCKTILELNRLQERCLQLECELKQTKEQLHTSTYSRTSIGVQTTASLEEISINNQENCLNNHKLTKNKVHTSNDSLQSSSEEKERNNQVILLKRVLSRLQQENSELKAIAAQQRKRIDELTNKAAELANHIAQQSEPSPPMPAEEPLNTRPQQPLESIIHTSLHTSNTRQPDSATWYPLENLPHTAHFQRTDYRRKHNKQYNLSRSISLTNSLSSDESTTEDVLREARKRLQKLEEESEAVDRSYRDFQARQADVSSITPLPVSSSQPISLERAMNPTYLRTDKLTSSTAQPIRTSFLQSRDISSPLTTIHGLRTESVSRLLPSSKLSSHSPARPLVQSLSQRIRQSFHRPVNIPSVQGSALSSSQRFSLIKPKANKEMTCEQDPPKLSSDQISASPKPMEKEKSIEDVESLAVTNIFHEENNYTNVHKDSDNLPITPEKDISIPAFKPQEKTVVSKKNEHSQSEKIFENFSNQDNLKLAFGDEYNTGENLPVNSNPPPLVNEQIPSTSLQPIEVESPEKVPSKTNVVDTTLNEISTYSSSPPSVIVESKSNVGNHNTAAVIFQNTEENLNVQLKSNQLLNTSLSSIENGNIQISGGSVEKKSEDDDDFW